MLLLTGLVCGALQGYLFESVTRLDRNNISGRFDEAFSVVSEGSGSVHLPCTDALPCTAIRDDSPRKVGRMVA